MYLGQKTQFIPIRPWPKCCENATVIFNNKQSQLLRHDRVISFMKSHLILILDNTPTFSLDDCPFEKWNKKTLDALVCSLYNILLNTELFCFIFLLVCKILNFNMQTAKHLMQGSWTELALAVNSQLQCIHFLWQCNFINFLAQLWREDCVHFFKQSSSYLDVISNFKYVIN